MTETVDHVIHVQVGVCSHVTSSPVQTQSCRRRYRVRVPASHRPLSVSPELPCIAPARPWSPCSCGPSVRGGGCEGVRGEGGGGRGEGGGLISQNCSKRLIPTCWCMYIQLQHASVIELGNRVKSQDNSSTHTLIIESRWCNK